MAKKKAAPKKSAAKKKVAAGKKQSRKDVEKVLAGPMRRAVKPAPKPVPKPRTMRLPEFGNISRIQELGEICQSLRGILDQEAEQRETKQGLRNNALQIMKKRQMSAYVEFGIEILRISGAEKINIRKVKAESMADEERDGDGDGDAGQPVGGSVEDGDHFDADTLDADGDQ